MGILFQMEANNVVSRFINGFSIKEGSNILVDTHFSISVECKEKAVEVYNQNYKSALKDLIINQETREKQGLLDCGACFVINSDGTRDLWTSNLGVATVCEAKRGLKSEKIIDANVNGELRAYRLEVKYSKSGYSVEAKLPNKTIPRDSIVVPLFSVVILMECIKKIVSNNKVYKIKSSIDNSVTAKKERFVTLDKDILAKRGGITSREDNDLRLLQDLFGFMYLPVLGANPLVTSGVTKVSAFSLDEMRVAENKEIRKFIAEEPEKALYYSIGLEFILQILDNEEEFQKFDCFDGLPKYSDFFAVGKPPTRQEFSSYYNQLSNAWKERCLKNLQLQDTVSDFVEMMGTPEIIPTEERTGENLRGMLRRSLMQIVIQKSNGSLSSMLCTNNQEILKQIYGYDYFKFFEGFNPRWHKMLKNVSNGADLREELINNGLASVETLSAVSDEDLSALWDGTPTELVKSIFSRLNQVEEKTESETKNILVRLCFSQLNSSGEVDNFYRYVDPDKVVKVVKFKDVKEL